MIAYTISIRWKHEIGYQLIMKDVHEMRKPKVVDFAYKQYSGVKRMDMDGGIYMMNP